MGCDFKLQGRRQWLRDGARSVKMFRVHVLSRVLIVFDFYTSAFPFGVVEVAAAVVSVLALAASSVLVLIDRLELFLVPRDAFRFWLRACVRLCCFPMCGLRRHATRYLSSACATFCFVCFALAIGLKGLHVLWTCRAAFIGLRS